MADIDVPMFETEQVVRMSAARAYRCGQTGEMRSWHMERNPKNPALPVCNRKAGHDGPHQMFNLHNYDLIAEWE